MLDALGGWLPRRPWLHRPAARIEPYLDWADPGEQLLKFFSYGHLPRDAQPLFEGFLSLASDIVGMAPGGPERTAAIRKLLEARDCIMRAVGPPQ